MAKRGTKLYSVLRQKCPGCQKGDMFEYPVFSIKFVEMHASCPACGFDFIQEPSFYFGAMYFSYAIQVVVFAAVYFALRYTIDPDTWTYVAYMITGSILILPLNYRLSRAAWINLFADYKRGGKCVEDKSV